MKLVAVLNKKHPLPVLLNGLAHATLGLARAEAVDLQMRSFVARDGVAVCRLTDYPFIILTARNSERLQQFHQELNAAGLIHNVFVSHHSHGEPSDQEAAIAASKLEELDYVAVVACAGHEQLSPLTKK